MEGTFGIEFLQLLMNRDVKCSPEPCSDVVVAAVSIEHGLQSDVPVLEKGALLR